MKKLLCLFLSSVLLLCLCACDIHTDSELQAIEDAAYLRGKAEVQEEIDDQQNTNTSLQRQIDALQEENERLNAEAASLTEENNQLKAEVQESAQPEPEPTQTAAPVSAPVQPEPAEPDPPTVTYIGNKNTGKFHYPSCHSVKQMKEKNKAYFYGDRSDVTGQGFQPCQNCNP